MTGPNSNPELPPSPMSAVAMSAVQLHEMFRSFVAAGFNEGQALQFVLAVWTEGIRRQHDGE